MKKVELLAAAEIAIMESTETGIILLMKNAPGFAALCVAGRKISPVFKGSQERDVYGDCREWFSDLYDGFLEVNNLDLSQDKVQKALLRAQADIEENL